MNFVWLPARTRVALTAGRPGTFLELRLGYPEFDPRKSLQVRGAPVEGGESVHAIRQGWNSYFIPLVETGTVEILIDHPLLVEGDQRYLGGMLSYAAVHDHCQRVAEIEAINQEIDAAVARRLTASSIEEWVDQLYQTVLNCEDEFYSRHSHDVPDVAELLDPVQCWSIHNKREKWLNDRVHGGLVVELGSGRGGLAVLKHRGCQLIGVDLSLENCRTACERGYDDCLQASGVQLPLADASVDYVVSADVLGHVPVGLKETLICEMYRVLKPGGECLHLIETDDFDPRRMPPADFARMVVVDGHVGIVPRPATEQLFSNYFELVDSFLAGHAWTSFAQTLRAHDLYGLNLPGELLARMHNASREEREQYDLGVGRTFWSLFPQRHNLADVCGTLFLHARKPG